MCRRGKTRSVSLHRLFRFPVKDRIIPELIDVGRFNASLAKTLTYFSLYAARVSCGENGCAPWHLTLLPKGIPVTVLESDETEIVPIEAVVQKPLSFLPPLSPTKIVLDPTAPLASILLTKFPKLGLTSIGITRWHPIGSDYVASRFIRTLSKFYQGIAFGGKGDADSYDGPERWDGGMRCEAVCGCGGGLAVAARLGKKMGIAKANKPELVYKAAKTYLPAPDRTCFEGIDTSAAEAYYPTGSAHPQLAAQPPNCNSFTVPSTRRVGRMRISSHGKTASSPLSLSPPTRPMQPTCRSTIDTILDVRGVGDIPKELAFNGFTFAPTDRITPADDNNCYTYAAAVRQSIMRGRTPQFLAALTDLQAERAAEAINRGEVMDLASPPGRILCNSTLRLDEIIRPEIHFGHPGKTCSYVGTVPFTGYNGGDIVLRAAGPRTVIKEINVEVQVAEQGLSRTNGAKENRCGANT
ncbi:hypothetical protein C8J57DRAFT_1236194 [Mycena rebaudengoi]|nr:hypothetical protein C8J57DRAFT_1236194 [Mycena rebaudengoi]